MNQKIITISFWIGIISLLIAPWALYYIDPQMFFPFITSKAFFWRFFIQIALVAWATCALLSPKYWINWRHPFCLALVGFMAIILLANTTGHAPYLSFWSNAERMDGYISLIYLAGWFVSLVGLLRTRKHVQWMLLYLLGISALLAVISWGQGSERVASRLGNPIYLASLSFFGVFISGYFLVGKEKFLRAPQALKITIFSLLAIAFVYTIFRTGTRGALLGLVGGGLTTAVLVALFAKDASFKIWRYLSIGLVIITLIFGGLFFGAREQLAEVEFVQDNLLLSRLVKISPEDRTTSFRLANWNMAIEGWKERPLLGWGQENYTEIFAKHYDVEKLYDAEDWYDRVHNNFLDWLVFGGIFGLLAYCALFVVPLYLIWKQSSFDVLEKSVLTGLFVGYLFQNMVAFDSLASGILLYACFAYVFADTDDGVGPEDPNPAGEKTFSYLVIIVLLIGSAFWIYHSIHLPRESLKNYIQWIQETGPRPSGELAEQALPLFEEIFEHDTFMERELTVHAMRQKLRFITPDIKPVVQQRYFYLISSNTSEMMVLHNHPTSLYSFYGAFLSEIGLYEQALPVLQVAQSKSPKKIKIIFREAHTLEQMGRIEEAAVLYKQGFDLAPMWEPGQRIYREFLERYAGK